MGLSLRPLGRKITEVLHGAERQINPFDQGATYKNPRVGAAPATPFNEQIVRAVQRPVVQQARSTYRSPIGTAVRIGAANLTNNRVARYNAGLDQQTGITELNQNLKDPKFVGMTFGGLTSPIKTKVTPRNIKPVVAAKNGVKQELKKGFVDKDAVILDELRNIEKTTGQKGLVEKFMYNSNMTRGSNAIANQVIQHSSNVKEAIGGLSKNDYKGFSEYANARTELSTAGAKTPTSLPKATLKATVEAGHPQYGARFDALNAHYKDLAGVAHEAGLIDKKTFDNYTANNDYVRLQRDMGELLPSVFGSKGYSLGKTVMNQKRTGSGREALPAGEVAANYTQQIYREAARNKTGIHLADTLHEAGLADKLIDSSDVRIRRDMYKFLAETKPGKVMVDKVLSRTKSSTRGLEAELNNLNKRGLKISLKKNNEGMTDFVVEGLGGKVATSKAGKVVKMNKQEKSILKQQGVTNVELPTTPSKLGPGDTRSLIHSLITKDPAELTRIKNMISHREPRLKALLDDVTNLQNESAAFNKARSEAFQTARAHADEVTRNKNTISVMRDGIREVYEVSPAIKETMQNINPYHMNAVMQVLSIPARTLRAGVTGLNPVFIARNLVKDQAGSAINSKAMLATHNPKVFFQGIYNATKGAAGVNNSQLWEDFVKHYGDQTSYDLTRNVKNTKQIVNQVRGGKVVSLGQHLKNPLRSLENIAQITEKSTRFQNFAGAYKKAIKQGLPKEQAMEKAAIQAWQNSVDFSRAGEWGRVINTVIPYWNPATQGVRQMGRTLHNQPVKSVIAGTTILGVPIAAATAYNLSHPDTKAVYDNISENEKDNNLVLVPPGTKQNKDGTYDVIKVPLPPGYKDVFMPIRRALEAYHNDKPLEGDKIARDILQATTGPIQTQTASQAVGSVIPQAVKPFVQQSANRDLFTGKQIVPDYMNQALDAQGNPIPEAKKKFKDSSGTARLAGEKINRSPIKVEKFIKDTAGTVGLNVLNAADRALAAKGVTGKNEIGGQSLSTGFKKSFASTQGVENHNKSEGAKYYDRLKTALKGLNGNEQSAFNSLHPAKKNFLGEQIYEADSTYNPAARLDIYNRYPKVFQADKKLDAQNKNHNPLFGLEQWQVKKVLEKDNLPPGADDKELSNLYKQDWYHDYSAKKSAYFSSVAAEAEKSGHPFGRQDNPYPVTPANVQKVMDYYTSLPKGTGARSAWIKANPGAWNAMQKQFASIDTWQNNQRLARGLDTTEGDAGVAAGYSDSNGGGSGFTPYKKKPPQVGSAYKYAVSPTAGGSTAKPKVSVKGGSKPKKYKIASKPKVTITKSKV